jgi:hypothetical protein
VALLKSGESEGGRRVTFDVAVDFAAAVQVLERVQHLTNDDGNVHLIDRAGFQLIIPSQRFIALYSPHLPHSTSATSNPTYIVEHTATAQILHNDAQELAVDVRRVVLRDVLAFALTQNCDFRPNVFQLVVGVLQIDHLI